MALVRRPFGPDAAFPAYGAAKSPYRRVTRVTILESTGLQQQLPVARPRPGATTVVRRVGLMGSGYNHSFLSSLGAQ